MDGAYLLHLDGPIAAGGFQNHTDGRGWEDWRDDKGRQLTAHEEASYQERIEAARVVREAEEARARSAAADKAQKLWAESVPCESHPYLAKKGVQSYGLRANGEDLIVPLYSLSGTLVSIQTITQTGAKRFLKGGRKQGCFLMLGTAIEASTLHLVEGYATGATVHEATGQPVIVAFDAGNLVSVAKGLRTLYPNLEFVFAADDDETDGNPGFTNAKKAAEAVGGRVVLPEWGDHRPTGATDFNDLAKHHGLDAVRACFQEPGAKGDAESISDAIKRLARLHQLEYEQIRVSEAKRLGIRASQLDDSVKSARQEGREATGKGPLFKEVEPWPNPVDGAALLDEIENIVHSFIICDQDAGIATALWIAFTWLISQAQVAPLLVITAPEKRCGKSQLLDLVSRLSCRSLVASNISPAAIFRVIERDGPTLMIDEADSFMQDNEEIRGILNSGHTRQSAYVIRCVGDNQEPRQFSTWGAKAISGIGQLSGTLMDRAIVVTLRRKLPTEKCLRLRHANAEVFNDLASKLARFATDAGLAIGQAKPQLPEELHDRAQDNWEALLAIADQVGGEWPVLARAAALNLSGAEHEPVSSATELLTDIKEIFSTKGVERISTAELLASLIADDLKSWANYAYGKPITPRQLAKRLGEFGIASRSLKYPGNVVCRGYVRSQFADAFERYASPPLPSSRYSATSEQHRGSESSEKVAVEDPGATTENPVADPTATQYHSATSRPAPMQQCSKVADPEGGDEVTIIDGRVSV